MKRRILFILSLGLVLALNIYFRAFPSYFPQLKTQAKDTVRQRISQEAAREVDKNFPAFSSPAKDRLVKSLVYDYDRQKKQEIDKQIQEEYLKLKDNYQDSSGQTYLMELDCWHWARYTDNVLRTGHPGDKIVNGYEFDDLMLAPSGTALGWNNFLAYSSVFLYKIFSPIKSVPLFTFLFYLPLFFTAIFIVALYLFCYYRFGNLAALVSCIFVGSAPIFVARSCAGWFDMDVLSLLLPLLITWTYLKAHGVLSFGRKILWICFSGFWTGIFCFTWPHWWFIFLIINIYEFYFLTNLVFMYLQYKEKNLTLFKEHFLSLCLFIFFSFFWIVVFAGPLPARELYYQVTAALRLNKAISSAFFWPNVYTTVAELKKANIIQIANSTGGVLSFVFSLFSMLLLFLRSSRNRRYSSFEYNSIIILVFWTLSMFFACYKGIRFSMFLALPLGICLGWVIKDAYAYFENRKMKWVVIFVLTITLLLSSNFIHNANSVAKNIYPLMNDDWHQALITIRDSTPKESVINSWWDFGDWFKVVSRRRVIFDGQSQNIPQAYWMAKVLASENEEEAIGILRMLNNGGNQAFNIINGHLKDSFKSILLLEKIIPLDPSTAKNNLLKFLPPSLAEEVIKLIFARPPEAYFVVDDSMQVKMSAISYLGNWDFLKAYMAGSTDKKEKERMINLFVELGGDPGQVQKFYQEVQLVSGDDLPSLVSHVLKFRSGLIKGKEKDGTVLFDAGLIYSPKEERFYVYSSQEGKYKIPKSLFVFQNDKIKEIVYPDNDLDFSVLMLKTKDGYASILLDRELAKSLFVRLYFLEGVGLKHFQPFTEEKKQDASIRVFKIIWD